MIGSRFRVGRLAAQQMSDELDITSDVFAQGIKIAFCALDLVFAESDGEIPAPEQSAEPGRGGVRVTVGCWIAEWRVPHAIEVMNDGKASVSSGADATQGRGDKSKRTFQFVATLLLKIFGRE
jgi:hypothetical protein